MTKAGEFLSGVLGLLGLSEPLSPNPCSEGLGYSWTNACLL